MNERSENRIVHPIEPVFDENSRILILGSFPSVKSRESGFFYGHKQNRFWKIMSRICGEDTPSTNEDKKAFLLRNKIALWDVIHSCEICGSSDSSIKNAVPNDLSRIINNSDIRAVFTNGKTAYKLYQKYNNTLKAVYLPSTSPANASWSEEKLYNFWKKQIDVYL